MNGKRLVRLCGYGTTLLLLYICLVVSTVLAQPARSLTSTSSFEIPAQPLPTALLRYTEQSGVRVIKSTSFVENKQSRGVMGQFDARTALTMLLEGTALGFEMPDGGSVVILPERATLNPRPNEKRAVSTRHQRSASEEREIVVTGSHISSTSSNGSQVYSFDRSDIAATGVGSIQEFMRLIPQNLTGGRSEASAALASYRNHGQDNIELGAGVNLRGLGNEATLVLINGHRMAPAGFGIFQDVSTLPLNAIERIYVLPDGLSAIYGSGAIGGVVNIILRESIDGAETELRYGDVTQGNSHELSLSQAIGTKWHSGSILFTGNYRERGALHATERDYAVDLWSGRNSLLPEEQRLSALLRASQQLSTSVDAWVDVYATDRDAEVENYHRRAAAQLLGKSETELLGGTATLAWASMIGWNVALAYAHSQTQNNRYTAGYRSPETIRTGIAAEHGLSTTELKAYGPAFHLPGGLAELAIGAERRHESMEVSRFGQSRVAPRVSGSRTVDAAYAELQLPLLSADDPKLRTVLAMNLALRYEDFSDVGATDNFKIGGTWSPIPDLGFHATWGTSSRAPYIWQHDTSFNTGVVMYAPNPASISGQSLVAIAYNGPHPALGSESATTWTAGFRIDPELLGNVHVSGTYFNIDYKDRIVVPFLSTTPFSDSQLMALMSMPPDPEVLEWVRSTPIFSNLTSSDLAAVDATLDARTNNQASAQVSGIDLIVKSEAETSIGTIAAALNANYFTRFDTRISPSAPYIDILNTVSNPVDFRGRAQVAWSNAGYHLIAAVNYVDDYIDTQRAEFRRISSWTTLDFGAAYSFRRTNGWLRDLTLQANVINATDKAPPRVYDLMGSYGDPGYDSASGNPLGRFISFQISKAW